MGFYSFFHKDVNFFVNFSCARLSNNDKRFSGRSLFDREKVERGYPHLRQNKPSCEFHVLDFGHNVRPDFMFNKIFLQRVINSAVGRRQDKGGFMKVFGETFVFPRKFRMSAKNNRRNTLFINSAGNKHSEKTRARYRSGYRCGRARHRGRG